MSKLNKQSEKEMIEYMTHLIEHGIYCYGNNAGMLARYLIGTGCRIHIGPLRKKKLEKILNEKN